MKKLLLPLAIFFGLLGAWSSAFSQGTNYDFSIGYYSTSEGSIGGSISGTLTSSASNGVLDKISNLVFQGISISNSNITSGSNGYGSYLPDTSFGYYDGITGHLNFQFVNPLSTYPSAASYVNLYTCTSQNAGVGCIYTLPPDGIYFPTRFNDQFAIASNTYNPVTYAGDKSLNISAGYAGAPEIDGSLAPKVGFLLGCLFLIFGRKRDIQLHMLNLEYTAKIKG